MNRQAAGLMIFAIIAMYIMYSLPFLVNGEIYKIPWLLQQPFMIFPHFVACLGFISLFSLWLLEYHSHQRKAIKK